MKRLYLLFLIVLPLLGSVLLTSAPVLAQEAAPAAEAEPVPLAEKPAAESASAEGAATETPPAAADASAAEGAPAKADAPAAEGTPAKADVPAAAATAPKDKKGAAPADAKAAATKAAAEKKKQEEKGLMMASAAEKKPFRESFLFMPLDILTIQRAIVEEAVAPPPNTGTGPAMVIQIDRKIILSGVFYRGPEDWTIWLNGRKLYPGRLLPEIIDIKVERDQVHLKWFDIGLNDIISVTMRPHQKYDIVTGLLLPG